MFDNTTSCRIEVKNCDILTANGRPPFFMKNGELNLLLDNFIIIDRGRFMAIPGAQAMLDAWRARGWTQTEEDIS